MIPFWLMTSMKPSKASRRRGPSASEAIRFGLEELTSEDCCRSSFPSDSVERLGEIGEKKEMSTFEFWRNRCWSKIDFEEIDVQEMRFEEMRFEMNILILFASIRPAADMLVMMLWDRQLYNSRWLGLTMRIARQLVGYDPSETSFHISFHSSLEMSLLLSIMETPTMKTRRIFIRTALTVVSNTLFRTETFEPCGTKKAKAIQMDHWKWTTGNGSVSVPRRMLGRTHRRCEQTRRSICGRSKT